MTDPLSDLFSYYGRRPNQFFLHELQEMLCPAPDSTSQARSSTLDFNTSRGVTSSDGTRRASYSLQKSKDGNSISLQVSIRSDGRVYETSLSAVRVRKDNLFEIQSLTFDNKKEKLGHRWEITSVLGFIGKNHLQKICEGRVPPPHEERGKFGKLGRFWSRCLFDNPHQMMMPPY